MSNNSLILGYDWGQRIEVLRQDQTAVFVDGSEWVATVRRSASDPISAEISTALGTIVRVDDNQVDVTIPGDLSALWLNETVQRLYFDLVRCDVDPPLHLGVRVTIPITRSITPTPEPH
jgi:hypothetical protein